MKLPSHYNFSIIYKNMCYILDFIQWEHFSEKGEREQEERRGGHAENIRRADP